MTQQTGHDEKVDPVRLASDKTELLVMPQITLIIEDGVPSKNAIEQWREWVKIQDGGEGSYGGGRLSTIDRIFDAALVGMRANNRRVKSFKREFAAMLRNMADQIEGGDE